jgi:hypothetical protein
MRMVPAKNVPLAGWPGWGVKKPQSEACATFGGGCLDLGCFPEKTDPAGIFLG